jgi:hypothetical protein
MRSVARGATRRIEGTLARWHGKQSGFVRLSAPELLSLCVLKEKVTKEK